STLHMVWIISKSYNTEEKMSPLLCRIAYAILQRVKALLDLPQLFTMPEEQAMEQIRLAKRITELWTQQYSATRTKIELAGTAARWEFEQKKLFGGTDYLGERCDDLFRILTRVSGLRRLLSPQLQSLT
ncbi:dynein heavy chain, partial [Kipferlia bialata]